MERRVCIAMKTISTILYGPIPFNNPSIVVKMNVILADSYSNYALSKFTRNGDEYTSINAQGRAVIRYIDKGLEWHPQQQIVITQQNIFQLRYSFKIFYKRFQRDDLYEYDSQGRVVRLSATENDEIGIELAMKGVMRLRPSTTTDRHGTIYPGVNITINREDYQVDLSIEEFEGLYDLILHMNIPSLTLSLIQIATSAPNEVVSVPTKVTKGESKEKVDWTKKQNQEIAKAPPKVPEEPKTLNDVL